MKMTKQSIIEHELSGYSSEWLDSKRSSLSSYNFDNHLCRAFFVMHDRLSLRALRMILKPMKTNREIVIASCEMY